MNYIEIQNEVIRRFNIRMLDHCESCHQKFKERDDVTHYHRKGRTIVKFKQKNSWASTFTLFTMIGMIEATNSSMRRAEEVYHSTTWALAMCREYGLEIPKDKVFEYQRWILLEKYRGMRRGGNTYGSLNLYADLGYPDITDEDVFHACNKDWRDYIMGEYDPSANHDIDGNDGVLAIPLDVPDYL